MIKRLQIFATVFLMLSQWIWLSGSYAQTTVTIAGNPGTTPNAPMGASNYHASEHIYLASEIGADLTIDRINFNVTTLGAGATNNFGNVALYLKTIPAGTTTLATGIYSTAGYTLVYSGAMAWSATGFAGVNLTTSFPYTMAAGNLELLVVRTDNVAHAGPVFAAAIGNSTSNLLTTSRRYNSATVAPVSGTTSLTTSTFRAAIQLIQLPPPCSGAPTPGNTVSTSTQVCPSVAFTLSLQTNSGSDLTYQWQGSLDGMAWNNIFGATSSNYIASQTVATYYQCIVTCPTSMISTTSTPILIAMANSAGTASANPTAIIGVGCAPGGTALALTGFPGGATLQWEYSFTGGAPWTTFTGVTTPTVNVTGIAFDIWFRCVVTACASTYNSNIVAITYTSTPLATANNYLGGFTTINAAGNATPYPSTVAVSGLTGTINKVVVQLCGVDHTWPSDVDIVLVAPNGDAFSLLADAGSDVGSGDFISSTLLLDDAAVANIPATGNIPSGTFLPTTGPSGVYSGTGIAGAINYPPGATFASVFNGDDPNGTWSLYVFDDAAGDLGNIDAWTLGIDMMDPCNNPVATVPATNGTVYIADYECPDSDEPNFTNYFDDAGTPSNNTDDYLLLSIDKLTNPDMGHIDDGTFAVQIAGAAGATWMTNPPAPYVEDPLFIVMNRWWNVTPNCATCGNTPNIDADANVRFYFTQQDFDDVVSDLIAGGAVPLEIAQAPDELFMYKINEFPGPYDADPANAHAGVPKASAYNQDGYWEYAPGPASSGVNWAIKANDYTGALWGAEFTVVAFSGGGGGGGSQGIGALPIELLYFTGHAETTANVIEWATATEKNNQYQIIERSLNGNDNWTEVGRVAGSVNSTETINYKLNDENPVAKAYYRLRALDFDGRAQLSEVIYIERESDVFSIMSVFPVPVEKEVTMLVNAPVSGDVSVLVTDNNGKLVSESRTTLSRGVNEVKVDMEKLPAGTYSITLDNGVLRAVQQVVK